MPPHPDDSPFTTRMKEIDDDTRDAPGLPMICVSWGCLLAVLVAAGAIGFAVYPYFAKATQDDGRGTRNQAAERVAERFETDSKDEAVSRACLGGLVGGLLGLGVIAAWGREDIVAALGKRKRK